ncbi:hypothetical protein KY362_03715 [Candidatus Woesearchaeota archaeon]|nr:hypothetical protein [Candidatus Woesearchaeota archaeon]
MKLFKKKKDRELEDLGLSEDEVLDFSDFEEQPQDEDFEKTFIFHITNGCPICGGDVKGNDHFKYFCKKCNVLFTKKDILDKEFGGMAVKKTKLTESEKDAMQKRVKELKDRVFAAFSEEEKKELKEEAKEEEPEEVEAEVIPPHEPEEEPEEVPEDTEPEEEPAPEPEYELEEAGKIIASSESTKLHSGQCHFAKRIHPQNRIYFETIEDGEEDGYEMCVCLRRMKAKGEIE